MEPITEDTPTLPARLCAEGAPDLQHGEFETDTDTAYYIDHTTDKDSPSSKVEREQLKGIPYASAIGSLMYVMVATRPDLAYTVGIVGCYMENPRKRHWEAVKHILRYLCDTYGSKKSEIPEGYTDMALTY